MKQILYSLIIIAIATILLIVGMVHIGLKDNAWVFYVGEILLFLFLFLYRDSLKSIKFKDIELTIEKAKSEIYAKESQIKRMGEEIASIQAESVAMQNRWVGDDNVLRREKRRENIINMLKNISSSDSRIKEVIEPLDRMILFDLFDNIIQKAHLNTMAEKKEKSWFQERAELISHSNLNEVSIDSVCDVDEIKRRLVEAEQDINEFGKEIRNLELFIVKLKSYY